MSNFFKKYDVQAPRYTSYPTVPYWSDSPTAERWIEELQAAAAQAKNSWSIYVHIPFCESLCTYCGCNTAITQNHGVESPYVDILLKELDAYLARVPALAARPLRELHLGGGTPTFLNAANLARLVEGILKRVQIDAATFQGSIEVHPGHTNGEQLQALYVLGFRRISMGVQDYDANVQRLVNRIQSFETTDTLSQLARSIGYSSVNHDLIYGLPQQTAASVRKTAELTLQTKPDRIALYSYAHVPWIKQAQRLFTEADLPEGDAKRELYEIARSLLLAGGYQEIGMDHFALPTDSLSRAHGRGKLHRNFMGYTHERTEILLGLGVSAISETPTCFHQNEKILKVYEAKVGQGEIATLRGHLLSQEDQSQREQILELMTRFELQLAGSEQETNIRAYLSEMLADGLVEIEAGKLKITERGRPFLRNVCMAFDLRLRKNAPDRKTFSKAI